MASKPLAEETPAKQDDKPAKPEDAVPKPDGAPLVRMDEPPKPTEIIAPKPIEVVPPRAEVLGTPKADDADPKLAAVQPTPKAMEVLFPKDMLLPKADDGSGLAKMDDNSAKTPKQQKTTVRPSTADKQRKQRLPVRLESAITKVQRLIRKAHPDGGSIMIAYEDNKSQIRAFASPSFSHYIRTGAMANAMKQSRMSRLGISATAYTSPNDCLALLQKNDLRAMFKVFKSLDKRRMNDFRKSLGIKGTLPGDDDHDDERDSGHEGEQASSAQFENKSGGEPMDVAASGTGITDEAGQQAKKKRKRHKSNASDDSAILSQQEKRHLFETHPCRLSIRQLHRAVIITLEVVDPGACMYIHIRTSTYRCAYVHILRNA
jgi:hypothetical protein